MSLEDDPEMIVHTFRMYFLGIGLTCFAAVLGQVSSSPFTIGRALAPDTVTAS